MYGKIFKSMYEGTLYGQWEAIVTFQQMIVLCDSNGILDMTPEAISARTSIPLDIIQRGLSQLSQPDPETRTLGHEGRRIQLIDEHRPWGWYIVNHDKYRALKSQEEIREKARKRKQKQRERERQEKDDVTQDVTDVTLCHTKSRYTDTDTDTDTEKNSISLLTTKRNTLSSKTLDRASKRRKDLQKKREIAARVIAFLNERANKAFNTNAKTHVTTIIARLEEGATEDQMRQVIVRKCRAWMPDERMREYLRPSTLFGRTKWHEYVGELVLK